MLIVCIERRREKMGTLPDVNAVGFTVPPFILTARLAVSGGMMKLALNSRHKLVFATLRAGARMRALPLNRSRSRYTCRTCGSDQLGPVSEWKKSRNPLN